MNYIVPILIIGAFFLGAIILFIVFRRKNLSLRLDSKPTPTIRLTSAPTPTIRLTSVPTPTIRLTSAPTPPIRLTSAPTPTIRLTSAPTPPITSAPTPTIRLTSAPTPTIRLTSAPTPTITSAPTPKITLNEKALVKTVLVEKPTTGNENNTLHLSEIELYDESNNKVSDFSASMAPGYKRNPVDYPLKVDDFVKQKGNRIAMESNIRPYRSFDLLENGIKLHMKDKPDWSPNDRLYFQIIASAKLIDLYNQLVNSEHKDVTISKAKDNIKKKLSEFTDKDYKELAESKVRHLGIEKSEFTGIGKFPTANLFDNNPYTYSYCSAIDKSIPFQYFKIELTKPTKLSRIVITNRNDNTVVRDRFIGASVKTLNKDNLELSKNMINVGFAKYTINYDTNSGSTMSLTTL